MTNPTLDSDQKIFFDGWFLYRKRCTAMKPQPPPAILPIPILIPEARAALARLHIELTLAFHATTFPPDMKEPTETDADLALVAVAVMFGHADGHPMTATEIALTVRIPRSTALARLNVLIRRGLIHCIKRKYYLEPVHAMTAPRRDSFELILSRAFAVLGPHLLKIDT